MGMEAACTLRVGSEQYAGKARLDADHIDFTGQTKFRFRLSEIRSPSYQAGALRFEFHGNKIALSVGDRTAKWYDAVMNPKTPAEKLGLPAGSRVRIINIDDEAIVSSLTEHGVTLIADRSDNCDAVLLGVERPADLRQIPSLADTLQPEGVIWLILSKSSRAVTQGNVQGAARNVGMTELKDVSVTEAFSAYRLARPARRNGAKKTTKAKTAKD